MLILHIIIALASVGFASYLVLYPSFTKLRVSYSFIALTITTGTALVIMDNSTLLHSCLAGLVYITFVSIITMRARTKLLALEIVKSRNTR